MRRAAAGKRSSSDGGASTHFRLSDFEAALPRARIRALSRRGGGFPCRCSDGVVLALRIARGEVRLELDFGEMFEMFGLAEELPALERPVGRLLTAEGRQRAVATYVLHETLPRVHKLIALICVRPMAVVQNIFCVHSALHRS